MEQAQLDTISVIVDAIQTGGLISALTIAVLAFARSWVYPASTVEELRQQIKELTTAIAAAGAGMERMADAWEARNTVDMQREWERRALSDREDPPPRRARKGKGA